MNLPLSTGIGNKKKFGLTQFLFSNYEIINFVWMFDVRGKRNLIPLGKSGAQWFK